MRKLALPLLALLVLLTACAPADPQSQLEKAVKQLSSDLPKQIDANTKLVDIEAGQLEVIYVYEVIGLSDEQVLIAREMIEQGARSAMSTNKSKLKFYVENQIPMTYVYRNTQGEELFRYTLNPWEA